MSGSILKIAPDPNPFEIEAPSIMALRLNRLVIEGFEVVPHIDCSLVVLKYPYKIKSVPSPIMLLGNGDLATFEGWPYELDRIFVSAGDAVKFDRFISGILEANQSWRGRLTKTKALVGEYFLIAAIGLLIYVAFKSILSGLF